MSYVMLLFLVPVPGTFLLLSSDIPLAIVPCNKAAPHCIPHGEPLLFLLIATLVPVLQLVYKLLSSCRPGSNGCHKPPLLH